MVTRYRTGPFSSLITGHSKFTPIENTKNSCHGGSLSLSLSSSSEGSLKGWVGDADTDDSEE
jgi:hypothetical protein